MSKENSIKNKFEKDRVELKAVNWFDTSGKKTITLQNRKLKANIT